MEDEMSEEKPTTKKDKKDKDISLAKITAFQAIAVALITAIATAVPVYFATRSARVPPPVEPPYSLITKSELSGLIQNAKFRIYASGFVLDPIDPKLIADKIKANKSFEAHIVLVKPSSKIVCQRYKDETENDTPGKDEAEKKTPGYLYKKLELQVSRFVEHRKESLEDKYQVKLSDAYPTMAVYVIDDDVCVYFYPYGAAGTYSPVLKFTNVGQKDERANFFRQHFDSVFKNATRLDDGAQYKNTCETVKGKT
jgi:hypothetical protein